jgi:hypothetical protein
VSAMDAGRELSDCPSTASGVTSTSDTTSVGTSAVRCDARIGAGMGRRIPEVEGKLRAGSRARESRRYHSVSTRTLAGARVTPRVNRCPAPPVELIHAPRIFDRALRAATMVVA